MRKLIMKFIHIKRIETPFCDPNNDVPFAFEITDDIITTNDIISIYPIGYLGFARYLSKEEYFILKINDVRKLLTNEESEIIYFIVKGKLLDFYNDNLK